MNKQDINFSEITISLDQLIDCLGGDHEVTILTARVDSFNSIGRSEYDYKQEIVETSCLFTKSVIIALLNRYKNLFELFEKGDGAPEMIDFIKYDCEQKVVVFTYAPRTVHVKLYNKRKFGLE